MEKGSSTIYLHVTSVGDMSCVENVLPDDQDEEENLLERIESANTRHMQLLTFIMHVSHVLLVVEPSCRVDPQIARQLRIVHILRWVFNEFKFSIWYSGRNK